MNRILTIIGLVSTVIYTTALYFLLSGRFSQLYAMPLNEVGDFMAGIFGPLAIFWLILGFFQQGKELQQSTNALELQAEELNNSVRQQKELVEISRKQFESEISAFEQQRNKEREQALPRFFFPGVGANHSDKVHKFSTDAKNTGAPVTNVELSMNVEMQSFTPKIIPTWDRNKDFRLQWEYLDWVTPEEAILTITFIDRLGHQGQNQFMLTGNTEGSHPKVEILEIEVNH